MQSATEFSSAADGNCGKGGEQSYHDFVTKGEIQYLLFYAIPALRRIWGVLCMRMFSLTENVHQLFKKDRVH